VSRYYQISYPRSGSHWLQYICRHMLGIRIYKTQDIETTGTEYVRLHNLPKEPEVNRKLIVIVRNPIECLIRQNIISKFDAVALEQTCGINNEGSYTKIIKDFDEWKNEKIIVYYEDLMRDPNYVIVKLAGFLKANPTLVTDLITNLDTHKKKCLDDYALQEGSQTYGVVDSLHSEKISEGDYMKILNFIKRRLGGLSKYLSRYNKIEVHAPKNILIQVDGVLLSHPGNLTTIMQSQPELLDGVTDKFNEWEKRGSKIILLTERKECYRKQTEDELSSLGVWYDSLIMGLTVGEKVLLDYINIPTNNRAKAICIDRNIGIEELEI